MNFLIHLLDKGDKKPIYPGWLGAEHPLRCQLLSSLADLMVPAQVDEDSRFLDIAVCPSSREALCILYFILSVS